ncbi:type II secretion system protein [Oceanithermus sp.]|uniref:pilin n=1 Tax=Oceanithermus sp. TaxID=2268145 RepID=UPI0025EB0EF8|nr:type II secretion system protein [Oceanithermus sp.]
MRQTQRGFTLIELVIVIVILGVLAAFALPRFIDVTQDARLAAVNGLAGSVRAAAALAHAQWLVDGQPTSISMEGITIDMVNGYPEVGNNGIEKALTDYSGFTLNPATPADSDTTLEFQLSNAPTPANCKVTYTEATASAPASVTVTTTGC